MNRWRGTPAVAIGAATAIPSGVAKMLFLKAENAGPWVVTAMITYSLLIILPDRYPPQHSGDMCLGLRSHSQSPASTRTGPMVLSRSEAQFISGTAPSSDAKRNPLRKQTEAASG